WKPVVASTAFRRRASTLGPPRPCIPRNLGDLHPSARGESRRPLRPTLSRGQRIESLVSPPSECSVLPLSPLPASCGVSICSGLNSLLPRMCRAKGSSLTLLSRLAGHAVPPAGLGLQRLSVRPTQECPGATMCPELAPDERGQIRKRVPSACPSPK